MNLRSIELFFHCVYCGKYCKGEPEYSIHRDGFGEGPEVPLCDGCGEAPHPTCEMIWDHLAAQRQGVKPGPLSSLN